MLLRFMRDKQNMNHSAAFNVLLGPLDQASRGLLIRKLQDRAPQDADEQSEWFGLDDLQARGGKRKHYEATAENPRRTLIYERGTSPIGLLRNCLDYALNNKTKLAGVFADVREALRMTGGRQLLAGLERVNDFRNTRVAHQEEVLDDAELAERELIHWIQTLSTLNSL
ncbi:MAG: hypothetical protein AAFU73_15640 [Planctomycetota bacterium]